MECFYSTSGRLQLPFSELSEEVKASKAGLLMALQESDDPCIKNTEIGVDGGRKANSSKSIQEARRN